MQVLVIEPLRIHPQKPPEHRIVRPCPEVREPGVVVRFFAVEPELVVVGRSEHALAVGTVALFPSKAPVFVRRRKRGAGDVVVEVDGLRVGSKGVEADRDDQQPNDDSSRSMGRFHDCHRSLDDSRTGLALRTVVVEEDRIDDVDNRCNVAYHHHGRRGGGARYVAATVSAVARREAVHPEAERTGGQRSGAIDERHRAYRSAVVVEGHAAADRGLA